MRTLHDEDEEARPLNTERYYIEMKTIVRSSDKAIFIELPDGRQMWFPKSQITGLTATGFYIPEWLAEEKL